MLCWQTAHRAPMLGVSPNVPTAPAERPDRVSMGDLQEDYPDGDADADRLGPGRGDHLRHAQGHDADHEPSQGQIDLACDGLGPTRSKTSWSTTSALRRSRRCLRSARQDRACADERNRAAERRRWRGTVYRGETATVTYSGKDRCHDLLLDLGELARPERSPQDDHLPDHLRVYEQRPVMPSGPNCWCTGNFHLGLSRWGGNYVVPTRMFNVRWSRWDPGARTRWRIRAWEPEREGLNGASSLHVLSHLSYAIARRSRLQRVQRTGILAL